jgi:glycosyltransferase involved in cell wall biosynthesis
VLQREASLRGPAVIFPPLAAPWLSRRLAAFAPDVVEYSNWGGLGACDEGRWRRVVRLSTPVAMIPAESLARYLLRPLHGLWESRTVARAHLVIADSRAMSRQAARIYGHAARIIIPHAYHGAVAGDFPTGDGVLFVGRLEPRKGVDVLLAAWKTVRERHPGAVLHLVGPDHAGFGAAQLARHGAAGVEVHGRLEAEALDAVRRQCRIQVVPSRFESFGLVVLEAFAAGLAVVAAEAGGLPEAVGEAGELVPPGDAAALARALGDLLADPALCASLVTQGRRRLRTHFALGPWVAATLEAYRSVLGKAG